MSFAAEYDFCALSLLLCISLGRKGGLVGFSCIQINHCVTYRYKRVRRIGSASQCRDALASNWGHPMRRT